MKPIRIQRKRTRGWRMPENTVYVGRPSKWGNPFPCGGNNDMAKAAYKHWIETRYYNPPDGIDPPPTVETIRRELGGKNLACWCDEGSPCHADVLLEIANS